MLKHRVFIMPEKEFALTYYMLYLRQQPEFITGLVF